MARLTRKNQKVFAESATNNGVFGSLQAGNPELSNDIEKIQSLPAYSQGWNAATMTSETLPSLEESQALNFINTYQLGYILQEGIPEYSASTTYYKGCLVKYVNGDNFQIIASKTDNNQGNGVTNEDYWKVEFDSANPPQLISNMEQTVSSSSNKYPSSAAVNAQLTQKENISNKQNDLNNPDSTHYPTTKAVVDGINSIVSDGIVTITDAQTITGLKYFRPKTGPCLVTVSNNIDSNIASEQSDTSILALDKNGSFVGGIVCLHTASGHNGMQLIARGDTTTQAIKIYDNGGTSAPPPSPTANSSQIATAGWVNSRITTIMDNYCGLPNYNTGVAIPTTATPAPYNCLVIVGVTSAHNGGYLQVNGIHFQIGSGRDDSHDSWLSLLVPKGVTFLVGNGPNIAMYYKL